MTEVQVGLLGMAVLLVLIALRLPIGVSLIGVSFCGIWYLMGWNVAWGALGVIPYQFSANWVLSFGDVQEMTGAFAFLQFDEEFVEHDFAKRIASTVFLCDHSHGPIAVAGKCGLNNGKANFDLAK